MTVLPVRSIPLMTSAVVVAAPKPDPIGDCAVGMARLLSPCEFISGRIDLHGRGHSGDQPHILWNFIEAHAYRHALRQANPGEDRIDRRETRRVRLRVG